MRCIFSFIPVIPSINIITSLFCYYILHFPDTQRGTFSQPRRLIDQTNQHEYIPLNNIAPDQAKIEIYNSLLSEAGVLGFEYGYSLADPRTLVLWEAQFGDFANGAQVIIDQFLA